MCRGFETLPGHQMSLNIQRVYPVLFEGTRHSCGGSHTVAFSLLLLRSYLAEAFLVPISEKQLLKLKKQISAERRRAYRDEAKRKLEFES